MQLRCIFYQCVLCMLTLLSTAGCDLAPPTTVATTHFSEVQGLLSFQFGEVYHYTSTSIDTIESWKGGKVDSIKIIRADKGTDDARVSRIDARDVTVSWPWEFGISNYLIVYSDVILHGFSNDSDVIFDIRPEVADTYYVARYSKEDYHVRRLVSRDTLIYSRLDSTIVHASCFEEISFQGYGSTVVKHQRTFISFTGHIIRQETWNEYATPSTDNKAFHRGYRLFELNRIVRSL